MDCCDDNQPLPAYLRSQTKIKMPLLSTAAYLTSRTYSIFFWFRTRQHPKKSTLHILAYSAAPSLLVKMFSGRSESIYFGFRIPPQGRPSRPTPTNESHPGRPRGPLFLWRRSPRSTPRPRNQEDQGVTSHERQPARLQSTPTAAPHPSPRTNNPPEVVPIPRLGLGPEIRNSQRSDWENERAYIVERFPGIQQDMQPQIRTTTTHVDPQTNRDLGARVETRSPSLYEDNDEQDVDSVRPDANPQTCQNPNYEERSPSLYENAYEQRVYIPTFLAHRHHDHHHQAAGAEATVFGDDHAPLLRDHDSGQDADRLSLHLPNSNAPSNNARRGEYRHDGSNTDGLPDERRSGSIRRWVRSATLSPAEAFCNRLLRRDNETRSRTSNSTVEPTSQPRHMTRNESREAAHRSNETRSETFYTAREPPTVREQAPSNSGDPPNTRDEAANTRPGPTNTGSQPTENRAQPYRSWEQRSSNRAGPSNPRALNSRHFLTSPVSERSVTSERGNTPRTSNPAPTAYVHPYVADPSVISEEDRQEGTGPWLH